MNGKRDGDVTMKDAGGASMKISQEQLQALAGIIGARNHEAMGIFLEEVFDAYREHWLVGRDTLPTSAELHKTVVEIEKRLAWILDVLAGKDRNPFLARYLSGLMGFMDQRDLYDAGDFAQSIKRLWEVAHAVNFHVERNPKTAIKWDGKTHHRRTRTEARDTVLIPGLVLCAQRYGDADLVDDDCAYETWDTICEFLTACMDMAEISAPDAGDTMHGEGAQGRLRRMVKQQIKEFRAMREERRLSSNDRETGR